MLVVHVVCEEVDWVGVVRTRKPGVESQVSRGAERLLSIGAGSDCNGRGRLWQGLRKRLGGNGDGRLN